MITKYGWLDRGNFAAMFRAAEKKLPLYWPASLHRSELRRLSRFRHDFFSRSGQRCDGNAHHNETRVAALKEKKKRRRDWGEKHRTGCVA